MSDPTPLQPGEIRFLDNSVPALYAGTYNITATHTVAEASFNINNSYSANQKFIVQAPRFSLPAGIVVSQYPAPGNEADFHEYMPFMVFTDQHLPWSRTILANPYPPYPTDTGYAPTWMALMLFEAGDLQYTPPPAPQQPNPTLATVRAITDIVGVNANNILGPQITLEDYEQTLQAASIDIIGTTFQALAPSLDELPFLAHLRQINTGGQTMDGMTGDGYYSVMLANRLPNPSAKTNYIVHLVSLEGWLDYLPGGTKTFTAGQTARLVSLNSWTFISDPAGADFKALVDNLDKNSLQLPFNPPLSWVEGSYTAAQTEAQTRYNNGYVALDATTRLGQNSFAWYRGPFTPVVPTMIENTTPTFTDTQGDTPLLSADQALIYDPVNGMFDTSYASAFEMGRLLTYANRPAALAIWAWKKDGVRLLQILNNILAQSQPGVGATALSARKPATAFDATPTIDWGQVKKDLTDPQAGHRKFMDYLTNNLGNYFSVDTQASQSSFVQLRNPSGLHQHLEDMPGLISPDTLHQLLSGGKDPHVYLSEKLNAVND